MQEIAILFANLKGNLGDFAILDSMIESLTKRHSHSHIDVFHHPFFEPDYEIIYRHFGSDQKFNLIVDYPRLTLSKIESMLLKLDPTKRYARQCVKAYAQKIEAYLKPFSPYDEIYFCGGDQWCGQALSISMFGSVLGSRSASQNISTFPFSVKANLDRFHAKRHILEYFNNLISPLAVRDHMTSAILNSMRITNQFKNDSVLKNWTPIKQFNSSKTKTANIREKSRVLFILKGNPSNMPAIFKSLKDGAYDVEFLSTSEAEDKAYSQEIESRFGYKTLYPKSWPEAVRIISEYDLVISNRLHGLIFSVLAGIAVLPVADRNKTRAFATDYNIPIFVTSIFELSDEHIRRSLKQVPAIELDEF